VLLFATKLKLGDGVHKLPPHENGTLCPAGRLAKPWRIDPSTVAFVSEKSVPVITTVAVPSRPPMLSVVGLTDAVITSPGLVSPQPKLLKQQVSPPKPR